uniref:Transketolase-like pyrimidine-binding domain-containing protein n=1 Tax=Hucho hucho TaxID=62062 RepID=A0A4W5PT30_9TELE
MSSFISLQWFHLLDHIINLSIALVRQEPSVSSRSWHGVLTSACRCSYVAIGCATRDRTVAFASTFAAFLSRAYDHIRMAAVSESNINLAGSHCGVSIGEDGPSQMALEDIAMFRAIPTCTVFYPSDGVSAERSVELAANTKVRAPHLFSIAHFFCGGGGSLSLESNPGPATANPIP